MKIALVGAAASIHIQRWVAFLLSRGHDVHVLSNLPVELPGATVWALPSKSRFGTAAYLLSIPRVARLLRLIRPELVHVHYLGGHALYACVLGGGRKRPPLVVTPWGSDVYRAGRIAKRLAGRLLRRADRILTTGHAMTAHLQTQFDLLSSRIQTVSWGIDLAIFGPASKAQRTELRGALGIPEQAFVVFSNRVAAPLYRTELIVRGFHLARRECPEMFLVLIEGPHRAELVAFRERVLRLLVLNNDPFQWVTGGVSAEEMAHYLQSADLALSIPISDQRSSSVLEALACCPRVGLSAIPAYMELKSEGYQTIDLSAYGETDLKQVLLKGRGLSEENAERDLSANYARVCRGDNWACQALKVESVYRSLARCNPRR